jgi:hypothetical protein
MAAKSGAVDWAGLARAVDEARHARRITREVIFMRFISVFLSII